MSGSTERKDYSELSDSELVVLIKKDDKSAFEYLFRSYYTQLFKFAYKFVNGKAPAEDVLQEVFLNIWENRDRLSINSSVKSYLFTSIRNRALNYLKKSEHEVHESGYNSTLFNIISPEHADHELISDELKKKINSAISALPEHCRRIFLMKKEDHLKYTEIADILGISPRTVEVQMGRALKKIRTALIGYKEFFSALIFLLF